MRLRNLAFPIRFLFVFILPLFVYSQTNDPRSGHNANVLKVEFSRDDKIMASTDDNGNIVVWDLPANKLLYRISGTTAEQYYLQALSPDGKFLIASKTRPGSNYFEKKDLLELRETATGKLLGALGEESDGSPTKVAFSPDDRMVIVQTDNDTSFWDLSTRQEKEMPFEVAGPFAFSPNGSQLAAVDKQGKLNLWNTSTNRRIRSFENLQTLDSVIFNHSGTLLASIELAEAGSTEGSAVKVWNLTSGLPVRSFAKVKARSLEGFSADNRDLLLAVNSSELDFTTLDPTLAFFNSVTAAKSDSISMETDFTGDLAGISSDLRLAAGTSILDSDIHLFDLQKKTELPPLKGYSIEVNSMFFNPAAPELLASYNDGKIAAWNISTGKFQRLIAPIPKDDSSVPYSRSISLCPQADCIFSKSPVHFYNVQTGAQIDNFEDDLSDAVYIFEPSGKTLFRISKETVSLYEVPTLRLKKKFLSPLPAFDSSQLRAAFSPDEKSLALEINSIIFIYDAASGDQLSRFPVREKDVAAIGFLQDGSRLIVSPAADFSAADSGIGIYDTSSGAAVSRITGQLQYFAVSPVGQTLATIDANHQINLWDTGGADLKFKTKNEHKLDSNDNSLLFSSDGKRLAVGGNHGIKMFDMISGAEIYTLQ